MKKNSLFLEEDTKVQDDISSHLDSNNIIEDEPSEPLENVKNHIYNKVENNGFSINDVNQAVDAEEAYKAEIRDISEPLHLNQKDSDGASCDHYVRDTGIQRPRRVA